MSQPLSFPMMLFKPGDQQVVHDLAGYNVAVEEGWGPEPILDPKDDKFVTADPTWHPTGDADAPVHGRKGQTVGKLHGKDREIGVNDRVGRTVSGKGDDQAPGGGQVDRQHQPGQPHPPGGFPDKAAEELKDDFKADDDAQKASREKAAAEADGKSKKR